MNISKSDEERKKCVKHSMKSEFLNAEIAIPPEHDLPAKLFPSIGPKVITKEYITLETITLIYSYQHKTLQLFVLFRLINTSEKITLLIKNLNIQDGEQ